MFASRRGSTPHLFYGWVVVAGAFTVMLVGFGCAYSFGAFVTSLQREFAASRGSVSMVFSLAGFLYFGLGAVSGALADRFGARRLALLGMLLLGTGLALAALARTLVQVYFAYALGVGLGVGLSYVPVVAAVQHWFIKRRGMASGLAVSGIGVGTLLAPPLATWLINVLGWRSAYLALGALAVLLGMAASTFIESDPARRGTVADGVLDDAPLAHSRPGGMTVAAAIRSRQFVVLYAACLTCAFAMFVPFVHLVPYAIDHGVANSSAVFLLGSIGVGSTAGRFVLGGFADRIGRHRALVLMFVGMGVAQLLWWFSSSLAALTVFALLYGTFYGGWVAVVPSVVMDYFGGLNLSTLIGFLYTSAAVGTLLGPSAAGYAFDVSGSYSFPILLCVLANMIAAGILAFASVRNTDSGGSYG